MEVKAVAKYVRVQPRKVRIIADEVRGKNAAYAAHLLRYHPSKSARALRKVLVSAMANAQENNNLDAETLKISAITIDEGPRLKRMIAKAMGRGARILKKTSHITVVVEDAPAEVAVKPHGTKAKPRPTFAAPTKGKKGAKPAAPKAEKNVSAAAQPVDETTDTDAEEVTAAIPAEATPVTAADAPEEAGSTAPLEEQNETTAQAEGATGEAESSEEKGAQ